MLKSISWLGMLVLTAAIITVPAQAQMCDGSEGIIQDQAADFSIALGPFFATSVGQGFTAPCTGTVSSIPFFVDGFLTRGEADFTLYEGAGDGGAVLYSDIAGGGQDYKLAVINLNPGSGSIPVAQGGSLAFIYSVTNNTDEAAAGDLYFIAARGGQTVAQDTIRAGTVAAGRTFSSSFTQAVPAGVPVGSYTYTLQIRLAPEFTVEDTAEFEVVVTGSARAGGATAWSVLEAAPWAEEGAVSDVAAESPATGSLSAYPNPFVGRATVGLELAEAEVARVVVYDVLGRTAAVLVDGVLDAGRHEVLLDGSALPSGVYLVRMTAGGVVQTQRITLVR